MSVPFIHDMKNLHKTYPKEKDIITGEGANSTI